MTTATNVLAEPGTVYLIHFDPAYKHARHYIGWARMLDARMKHHQNGTGANLTKVAVAAGSKLVLARTWKDDRNFERKLKNRKDAPLLCPVCNPTALKRAT